jgi:hypothetical protein
MGLHVGYALLDYNIFHTGFVLVAPSRFTNRRLSAITSVWVSKALARGNQENTKQGVMGRLCPSVKDLDCLAGFGSSDLEAGAG